MCINVNIHSFGAHQNEVYFCKSPFAPAWFTSLGTCIGRDQLNFFLKCQQGTCRQFTEKTGKQARRNSNNLDASKKQPQLNLRHIFGAQQNEKGMMTGN